MLRGKKGEVEDILRTEETYLSLRTEERKMSTIASLQGQEDVEEARLTFTVEELCLSAESTCCLASSFHLSHSFATQNIKPYRVISCRSFATTSC